MKIYLYKGGRNLVGKSGVGSAIRHQEQMLKLTHAPLTEDWKEATVVHVNTVFPDSMIAAAAARRQKKKVVYYGHSTMEDFRNSFIGSNLAAPLFKRWICRCYSLGDVILTPTEYSAELLKTYGIRKPIYPVTNGVDTDFFHPDADAGRRFREKYGIPKEKKIVISAGHLIRRKGIFDFLALARQMQDTVFIWFGGGNSLLVPRDVKRAVKEKSSNVIFAGYVPPEELKGAYCGADAFAFFSYEETEGIVVLEALACGIPVIVRDIPVYEDWLKDGRQVCKVDCLSGYREKLENIFAGAYPKMTEKGRSLAEEHSLYRTGELLNTVYQQEELWKEQRTW